MVGYNIQVVCKLTYVHVQIHTYFYLPLGLNKFGLTSVATKLLIYSGTKDVRDKMKSKTIYKNTT